MHCPEKSSSQVVDVKIQEARYKHHILNLQTSKACIDVSHPPPVPHLEKAQIFAQSNREKAQKRGDKLYAMIPKRIDHDLMYLDDIYSGNKEEIIRKKFEKKMTINTKGQIDPAIDKKLTRAEDYAITTRKNWIEDIKRLARYGEQPPDSYQDVSSFTINEKSSHKDFTHNQSQNKVNYRYQYFNNNSVNYFITQKDNTEQMLEIELINQKYPEPEISYDDSFHLDRSSEEEEKIDKKIDFDADDPENTLFDNLVRQRYDRLKQQSSGSSTDNEDNRRKTDLKYMKFNSHYRHETKNTKAKPKSKNIKKQTVNNSDLIKPNKNNNSYESSLEFTFQDEGFYKFTQPPVTSVPKSALSSNENSPKGVKQLIEIEEEEEDTDLMENLFDRNHIQLPQLELINRNKKQQSPNQPEKKNSEEKILLTPISQEKKINDMPTTQKESTPNKNSSSNSSEIENNLPSLLLQSPKKQNDEIIHSKIEPNLNQNDVITHSTFEDNMNQNQFDKIISNIESRVLNSNNLPITSTLQDEVQYSSIPLHVPELNRNADKPEDTKLNSNNVHQHTKDETIITNLINEPLKKDQIENESNSKEFNQKVKFDLTNAKLASNETNQKRIDDPINLSNEIAPNSNLKNSLHIEIPANDNIDLHDNSDDSFSYCFNEDANVTQEQQTESIKFEFYSPTFPKIDQQLKNSPTHDQNDDLPKINLNFGSNEEEKDFDSKANSNGDSKEELDSNSPKEINNKSNSLEVNTTIDAQSNSVLLNSGGKNDINESTIDNSPLIPEHHLKEEADNPIIQSSTNKEIIGETTAIFSVLTSLNNNEILQTANSPLPFMAQTTINTETNESKKEQENKDDSKENKTFNSLNENDSPHSKITPGKDLNLSSQEVSENKPPNHLNEIDSIINKENKQEKELSRELNESKSQHENFSNNEDHSSDNSNNSITKEIHRQSPKKKRHHSGISLYSSDQTQSSLGYSFEQINRLPNGELYSQSDKLKKPIKTVDKKGNDLPNDETIIIRGHPPFRHQSTVDSPIINGNMIEIPQIDNKVKTKLPIVETKDEDNPSYISKRIIKKRKKFKKKKGIPPKLDYKEPYIDTITYKTNSKPRNELNKDSYKMKNDNVNDFNSMKSKYPNKLYLKDFLRFDNKEIDQMMIVKDEQQIAKDLESLSNEPKLEEENKENEKIDEANDNLNQTEMIENITNQNVNAEHMQDEPNENKIKPKKKSPKKKQSKRKKAKQINKTALDSKKSIDNTEIAALINQNNKKENPTEINSTNQTEEISTNTSINQKNDDNQKLNNNQFGNDNDNQTLNDDENNQTVNYNSNKSFNDDNQQQLNDGDDNQLENDQNDDLENVQKQSDKEDNTVNDNQSSEHVDIESVENTVEIEEEESDNDSNVIPIIVITDDKTNHESIKSENDESNQPLTQQTDSDEPNKEEISMIKEELSLDNNEIPSFIKQYSNSPRNETPKKLNNEISNDLPTEISISLEEIQIIQKPNKAKKSTNQHNVQPLLIPGNKNEDNKQNDQRNDTEAINNNQNSIYESTIHGEDEKASSEGDQKEVSDVPLFIDDKSIDEEANHVSHQIQSDSNSEESDIILVFHQSSDDSKNGNKIESSRFLPFKLFDSKNQSSNIKDENKNPKADSNKEIQKEVGSPNKQTKGADDAQSQSIEIKKDESKPINSQDNKTVKDDTKPKEIKKDENKHHIIPNNETKDKEKKNDEIDTKDKEKKKDEINTKDKEKKKNENIEAKSNEICKPNNVVNHQAKQDEQCKKELSNTSNEKETRNDEKKSIIGDINEQEAIKQISIISNNIERNQQSKENKSKQQIAVYSDEIERKKSQEDKSKPQISIPSDENESKQTEEEKLMKDDNDLNHSSSKLTFSSNVNVASISPSFDKSSMIIDQPNDKVNQFENNKLISFISDELIDPYDPISTNSLSPYLQSLLSPNRNHSNLSNVEPLVPISENDLISVDDTLYTTAYKRQYHRSISMNVSEPITIQPISLKETNDDIQERSLNEITNEKPKETIQVEINQQTVINSNDNDNPTPLSNKETKHSKRRKSYSSPHYSFPKSNELNTKNDSVNGMNPTLDVPNNDSQIVTFDLNNLPNKNSDQKEITTNSKSHRRKSIQKEFSHSHSHRRHSISPKSTYKNQLTHSNSQNDLKLSTADQDTEIKEEKNNRRKRRSRSLNHEHSKPVNTDIDHTQKDQSEKGDDVSQHRRRSVPNMVARDESNKRKRHTQHAIRIDFDLNQPDENLVEQTGIEKVPSDFPKLYNNDQNLGIQNPVDVAQNGVHRRRKSKKINPNEIDSIDNQNDKVKSHSKHSKQSSPNQRKQHKSHHRITNVKDGDIHIVSSDFAGRRNKNEFKDLMKQFQTDSTALPVENNQPISQLSFMDNTSNSPQSFRSNMSRIMYEREQQSEAKTPPSYSIAKIGEVNYMNRILRDVPNKFNQSSPETQLHKSPHRKHDDEQKDKAHHSRRSSRSHKRTSPKSNYDNEADQNSSVTSIRWVD